MRKKIMTSIVCSFLIFNLTNATILTAAALDLTPKPFDNTYIRTDKLVLQDNAKTQKDTHTILYEAVANAYTNRGVEKYTLGQYIEAIQDFSKVIEINPNDVEAYNNRGAAKHILGQYIEAIQDYSKAIELDPNLVEAYQNIETIRTLYNRR